MFTEQQLKESSEFKEWIQGEIALIHNCYFDAKEPYGAYIVISKEDDDEPELYSITRFFQHLGSNHVYTSVDHQNITAKKVFELLLSEYSRGLA